jgi:hypothetical protein
MKPEDKNMKIRSTKKQEIRDDNERDRETAEGRKGNNETGSGIGRPGHDEPALTPLNIQSGERASPE